MSTELALLGRITPGRSEELDAVLEAQLEAVAWLSGGVEATAKDLLRAWSGDKDIDWTLFTAGGIEVWQFGTAAGVEFVAWLIGLSGAVFRAGGAEVVVELSDQAGFVLDSGPPTGTLEDVARIRMALQAAGPGARDSTLVRRFS